MNENSVLYDALAERVELLANSFDNNVPYHKFTRRYLRREKKILKAYLKSKSTHQSMQTLMTTGLLIIKIIIYSAYANGQI